MSDRQVRRVYPAFYGVAHVLAGRYGNAEYGEHDDGPYVTEAVYPVVFVVPRQLAPAGIASKQLWDPVNEKVIVKLKQDKLVNYY